jgi:hypothetical protein
MNRSTCSRDALAESSTLWSDDPTLRVLARGSGIQATSTYAALDHLAALGQP